MDLSVRPELATRNPLLICPTPVYRIYQGGLLLERFRGVTSPKDGDFPEDWVGSVTDALNVGREGLGEGLSVVVLPDGSSVQLKELVVQYPKAILGEKHVSQWGVNTALLVKLLDAAVRLPVHCHPDRAFARKHMNSSFGKTECWIIKETRTINGVKPYLALGFHEGSPENSLLTGFRNRIRKQC
jgi:mannose-6-phosphate isomerase